MVAACSSFSLENPPAFPIDDPLASALTARGDSYEARQQISELNRKRDWDGLLRYALALLRADPGGTDGGVLAGYAWLRLGDYPRSIAALTQVVKQNPEDIGAWNLLGESQRRAGQPGQATRTLERASTVGRTSYVTYFFLGEAYRDARRLDRAIPAYRECVRLEPNFAQGWFEFGAASARIGNQEDIAGALQSLQKLNPSLAGQLKRQVEAQSTKPVR